MRIHLGYEVTDGAEPAPISLPMHHMMITGMTRLSGKTTTIEALVSRLPEGFTALVFRTKRGEVEFRGVSRVHPYYRPEVDWEYVKELLEAAMRQRLRMETSWIIRASKGAGTLREVYENVQRELRSGKLRGIDESMYTNLGAYFEKILPQLEEHPFASELVLAEGVNVMELGHFSEEVQSLVISSCLEAIQQDHHHTVVVIPEAWLFLPQARGNPVKWSAQHVIRQGGASENYLWLDSQDVTTVTKDVLKSVGVWLLGRQQEINEVKRVLDQLPTRQKPKPDEIMTLPVGHFYVAMENVCKMVYIQPAWVDDPLAILVARGQKTLESVREEMPPPRIPSPPGPSGELGQEELKASLARAEVASDQLEAECINLQQKVLDLERTLALQEERLEAFDNFKAALNALILVGQPLELTESILDGLATRVANKLGQTTEATMLRPLEALKHRYQQEVVDRLSKEIAGWDLRQREGLKWLIATGRSCTFSEVARNLGYPTAGASFTKFNQEMKVLVKDDWLTYDRHTGLKSNFHKKVKNALAAYDPSTEEIMQTVEHLAAQLAK